MARTTLLKQTADSPLFGELLWSKPESKLHAGKLLIIGGNSFRFAAVGEAYEQAIKAGAGEVRVLLPDVIQKIAGGVFEHALFAPTNPSGSFSKDALNTCLEAANWADGVLIVGDVSRNAETASMLELFYEKYSGPLIVTKDALELALKQSTALIGREQTGLIMTMHDVQLLAKTSKFTEPLTFESSNELFAQRMQQLLKDKPAVLTIAKGDGLLTVSAENTCYTPGVTTPGTWRTHAAAKSAVWLTQFPKKPFEAIATSSIA